MTFNDLSTLLMMSLFKSNARLKEGEREGENSGEIEKSDRSWAVLRAQVQFDFNFGHARVTLRMI